MIIDFVIAGYIFVFVLLRLRIIFLISISISFSIGLTVIVGTSYLKSLTAGKRCFKSGTAMNRCSKMSTLRMRRRCINLTKKVQLSICVYFILYPLTVHQRVYYNNGFIIFIIPFIPWIPFPS